VCTGAAVLAIALSLLALSAVVLVAAAGGIGGLSLSEHPLRAAAQDGAVLFYLAQLVSVSFFDHTAGLRFAALPGLALVALAIAVSAMVAARLIGGSVRRRMLAATLTAIPYALLAGLGARYLPLRLTGPVIGSDTAVSPAGVEAFLLPLAWGLLFAPLGGLLGVSGGGWRRDAARLLGPWATPARCSLRALAAGLAMTSLVVVVSGAVLIGGSGEARSFIGGNPGHVAALAGGALIALPTLVITTFLACFGVSFDWHVEALSSTQGSGSIFGGTLPSTGTAAHQMPGMLGLLLLVATVTVFSAGRLAARRSGADVRLGIATALRAGVLMTLACWLLALFARVDAQAGGYLGIHFGADVASLLWCVPLWCLLGSIAGSVAYVVTRGAASRRELATALRALALPSSGAAADSGWRESWRRGLTSHAALGASFLSVPAMLIGIGPAGAPKPAGQATMSLAPISRAAEQRLRPDTVRDSRMYVAVDPNTRVVDSARVRLPVTALGVSPDQSPSTKARAVLTRYGSLFGASGGPDQLGTPQVLSERKTSRDPHPSAHVYFKQMVDGIPVYGNSIGVHFSPGGKEVDFVDGSFIPEVTLADAKPAIDSARAVALARVALPGGKLVHSPRLEVYAGPASHPFGPTARLAWFVWLSTGPGKASEEYVVDAVTGSILNVFNMGFHAANVEIFNAEEKEVFPETPVWTESEKEPPKDEDAKYAEEYLKDAWNFFAERLKAPSCKGYDCKNKEHTKATVHFGKVYKGAEWNSEHQEIYFGNKDSKALDLLGHEYAGGISEHTTMEKVEGETGALLEGWADAMGKGLEAYVKKEGTKWSEPIWKVGYEVVSAGIRNLEKPHEHSEIKGLEDPEKLSEYRTACQDNGDVHENSTIIGHAFYLLTKKIGIQKATEVFWKMQTIYFADHPNAELEEAPGAAMSAAAEVFPFELEETKEAKEAKEADIKDVENVFTKENEEGVGLNGTTKPTQILCKPCPAGAALADEEPVTGAAPTLDMLATLYRARGKLAQPSAAGHYFMPLYEAHMSRIAELVSRDPTLEEMTVNGLRQIEPALNALAEGEGQTFKLSASEMAEIEAALKRLAQDDRLYSGGGPLAELIERELKWLNLPSYAGATYAAGFDRLNTAAAPLSEKAPPPTGGTLVDPNCENPYTNSFQVYGFTVATPGHGKPGEVSPIDASGVACGTAIEATGKSTECHGEGTLNEKLTLELPPGDKIDSTKEMKEGSWIGRTTGRAVGCAGEFSEIVTGGTGITSVKTWTSAKCPEAAVACYKSEGSYKGHEGVGYAWVEEKAGRLVLTTGPMEVFNEGHRVPVGFTQFGVELCAHAGESGTEACGTPAAPWIHKNGTESQPGCQTENEDGRYVIKVTKVAEKEKHAKAETCVYWGEEKYTQAVDPGNSLNAVSCVPETTDCAATDNKGNTYYSTNISATESATWMSWSGPSGASPGEAVACPSSSLCTLGDGKVEKGGGGNMYYATSLGGAWSEAFKPSNGVLAISCPSSSFCVDSQESGSIRYATKPGSTSWTNVAVGSGALNAVSCLSASFCAIVNGSGDLYVANTEAHIKEASGWKSTDIDGSAALHGVACRTTISCVAVDGEGHVLDLTLNGSGEATVSKLDIDGTNDLTAVTCVSEAVCVAVDKKGNVLVSTNGATWNEQHKFGTELTSVSCASTSLCAAVDMSGNVTTFAPLGVPPSDAQTIDSGNSLAAVACVPKTAECAASDSKGGAFYATKVSAATSATWKAWSGPSGATPSEAIACPTNTLCVFADGKAEEGGGGNMYYATSLGGAWKEAFAPVWGVDAVSCPSSSFCVAGQAEGFIRYSTSPASSAWEPIDVATGEVNALDCLSSSFCALANSKGGVYVANTEAKIKEEHGWKSKDIDGSHPLHGIACTTTTWCLAIDGEGRVFELTINSSGETTVLKEEDLDGANDLTAITCIGETCAITDSKGNVFVSVNAGETETWRVEHTFGTEITGLSCSASTLCVATDKTGEVTAFEPE
jgi:Zn-dependent metalloprotease